MLVPCGAHDWVVGVGFHTVRMSSSKNHCPGWGWAQTFGRGEKDSPLKKFFKKEFEFHDILHGGSLRSGALGDAYSGLGLGLGRGLG